MNRFIPTLIRNLLSLIFLNLLFLVFGLLIVSIPASFSAMTKVINKILEEEEDVHVWYDFLNSFRMNFKEATIFGLLSGLLLTFDFYTLKLYSLFSEEYAGIAVLQAIAFIITIYLICAVLIGNMLLSCIELSLKAVVKNAILLVFVAPVRTIGAVMAWLVIMVPCILLFPRTIPIIILIACSGAEYCALFLLRPAIIKYIIKH